MRYNVIVKKITYFKGEGVFEMSRFTLPRDIYHGKGCLEELKNLKGKKAILVVGGGSMKRQGFLDRAENYLKEAGMEVKLFEGVEPDPSVETVMKGAAVMQEFQPELPGIKNKSKICCNSVNIRNSNRSNSVLCYYQLSDRSKIPTCRF